MATELQVGAAAARDGVTRVMAAAALSMVVGVLPVFLFGGLALLVRRDLGFGQVHVGIAVSAFFTVGALTSVIAGRIAHRMGPWASTVMAAGISATALAGVAAAPTFPFILAALALGGFGNAMSSIGSNDSLARGVPRSRQGLGFGIKQAAIPAATLLAGAAVPAVGLTLGWRAAFAAATLLAAGYVAVAPRTTRRGVHAASRRDRTGDAAVGPLLVVAGGGALGAAAANALAAFLVESAVHSGFGPAPAGLLLAGSSALGVVVRVFAGWRADRRPGRPLASVAGMLACGAVGLALMATGSAGAVAVGAVLAFGLGWSWPGLLNFAVVQLNPNAPAVATSITQTGIYGGGAIGPVCFGLLLDATSYRLAWSVAALAMLAAAVLVSSGGSMLGEPMAIGESPRFFVRARQLRPR